MNAGTPVADQRAAALRRLAVSRETEAALDAYVDLLRRWQPVKNLVAPGTLDVVWSRHVLDSGQLVRLFPQRRIWADFGSGAGLPGIIIAILLLGVSGARVHLIESNQRKAAFLLEAVRVTGAPAVVHAGRIEDVVPRLPAGIEMVTARALAPLADLLRLALPLLKTGAQAAFPKGQDIERELTEAAKSWRIHANLIPSDTDPAARIVHVEAAEPAVAGPV